MTWHTKSLRQYVGKLSDLLRDDIAATSQSHLTQWQTRCHFAMDLARQISHLATEPVCKRVESWYLSSCLQLPHGDDLIRGPSHRPTNHSLASIGRDLRGVDVVCTPICSYQTSYPIGFASSILNYSVPTDSQRANAMPLRASLRFALLASTGGLAVRISMDSNDSLCLQRAWTRHRYMTTHASPAL